MRIFSTPATSVPSEQAFSTQNIIHDKKRTTLSQSSTNMLSYIHVNRRLLDRKKSEICTWYDMEDSELALLEMQIIADTEDRQSWVYWYHCFFVFFRFTILYFCCLFVPPSLLLACLMLIHSLQVLLLNRLFIFISSVKIHVCNYTYSPLLLAASQSRVIHDEYSPTGVYSSLGNYADRGYC